MAHEALGWLECVQEAVDRTVKEGMGAHRCPVVLQASSLPDELAGTVSRSDAPNLSSYRSWNTLIGMAAFNSRRLFQTADWSLDYTVPRPVYTPTLPLYLPQSLSGLFGSLLKAPLEVILVP